jgi:rhodanese-related sulfurtransferase
VDVSPRNENPGTITIQGFWESDILTPVRYPEENITCFLSNRDITLTANPKDGYQFEYWEFSLWPQDLNESTDRTSNPITFRNINYDYPDSNYARVITAHFTRIAGPPPAPQNVEATDGQHTGMVVITWSSVAADSYKIYRADSRQGNYIPLDQTTGTSYEDTTVTGENVYYYRVKASNQYGDSSYSEIDSGYAYVDPTVEPPPPVYEYEEITVEDAKQMLDTMPDVIVMDVSIPAYYQDSHILCAINRTWDDLFENMNYDIISDYTDYPVLVYDQDETTSASAANFLSTQGFSEVYHLTGGLDQWMTNGFETVDSSSSHECSLPPMALAGQDLEVFENETLTLDGSGSQAPDNNTMSYEWEQFSGTTATIVNPASAQTEVISPYVQEGGERLIFHLIVTDSQNNRDTDSVSVDVIWSASEPVADAGENLEVLETHRVQLDGSGSYDNDGDIESYAWAQVDGSGHIVGLVNPSSASPYFTAPELEEGTVDLVFQLTVTNTRGTTSTDEVTVTVVDGGDPPKADAGIDQTGEYPGREIHLDGSGSEGVSDDSIQSYEWTQVSGPTAIIRNANSPTPTVIIPEIEGESAQIVLELTVTDENGLINTDQVKLVVSQATEPPTANAGEDQEVIKGSTVVLDGSESSDPDDGIASYAWSQTGQGPTVELSGNTTQNPEFTAPDVEEETVLTFELTVADSAGNEDTDQVGISVLPTTSGEGGGGGGGGCFISTLKF